MSDRIALVNKGRIEQLGEVHEIYHRPATAFAAEFIGNANLLKAELLARAAETVRVRVEGGLELELPAAEWPTGSSRGLLAIRPEKVHVSVAPVTGQNTFEAVVEQEVFKGATDRLTIRAKIGTRLVAVAANESSLLQAIHEGDRVWCALHASDLVYVRE